MRLHLSPVNSIRQRRYATTYGLVPTVVSRSQEDWYEPSHFTYDRLYELIGRKNVRKDRDYCAHGAVDVDTMHCHSIKEADPRLVGKEWASLRASNLTALGVETYADFMKVQVRRCASCAHCSRAGRGAAMRCAALRHANTLCCRCLPYW